MMLPAAAARFWMRSAAGQIPLAGGVGGQERAARAVGIVIAEELDAGADQLLAPLEPGMVAPPHAMPHGATEKDYYLGRVSPAGLDAEPDLFVMLDRVKQGKA